MFREKDSISEKEKKKSHSCHALSTVHISVWEQCFVLIDGAMTRILDALVVRTHAY